MIFTPLSCQFRKIITTALFFIDSGISFPLSSHHSMTSLHCVSVMCCLTSQSAVAGSSFPSLNMEYNILPGRDVGRKAGQKRHNQRLKVFCCFKINSSLPDLVESVISVASTKIIFGTTFSRSKMFKAEEVTRPSSPRFTKPSFPDLPPMFDPNLS